jgi:hypothetical protein
MHSVIEPAPWNNFVQLCGAVFRGDVIGIPVPVVLAVVAQEIGSYLGTVGAAARAPLRVK